MHTSLRLDVESLPPVLALVDHGRAALVWCVADSERTFDLTLTAGSAADMERFLRQVGAFFDDAKPHVGLVPAA